MCHVPSSYVLVVDVDRALIVIDFECFASAGCVFSEARLEFAIGVERVRIEVQVKVDNRVGVDVEDEDAYFKFIMLVEVWLVGSVFDESVDVSAGLTTMYDIIFVGEELLETS